MSWTYSGNPKTSSKDAVRFLIGDTKSDGEKLATDEEIDWALEQNSNIYAAAATVADNIATYFSTLADSEELGPIKVSYNNRVKMYSLRVKQLNMKASSKGYMEVYAGGIDVNDKESQASDSSLTGPNFTIGMNDLIGTGDLLS